MRILIAAAAVLLYTGISARAEPSPTQWVLAVPFGSSIWTPGIYTSEERCEKARKAFVRSTGMRKAVCAELLGPA